MVPFLLIGIFFILLIVGIPISFAIGLSGIATVIYLDQPLTVIAQRFFGGIDSFSLLAIPFFILAGKLMDTGGIATRLIDFANCLVGFIKGGLAMVNTLASLFFGGISGSSVADAAATGSILIPEMKRKGYDGGFAAAITAASSTIGIIIPPSIPLIIYGGMAGVSISQLFMAGIIPGVLVGLGLMLTTYILASRYPQQFPKEKVPDIKEVWVSFRRAALPLLMPVFVLGGIIGGIVTPTEAAVIAVAYALLVGGFIFREIKISDAKEIIDESIKGTAAVMFLVGAASLFGWLIAIEQIPQMIGSGLENISSNPIILLFLMLIIILITGLFMDLTANLIILTPVLLPIAVSIGIDPIHFGITMIIALAIGLITPPVGLCLFVCCNIAKISVMKISKSIIPLLITLTIILLAVAYLPNVTMFLPTLLE